MGWKADSNAAGIGRLRRAASAVARFFSRHREVHETVEVPASEARPHRAHVIAAAAAATTPPRITRRETDIPMDVLNQAYTPSDTSSKASFRSDGADHQHDQEFAHGAADSRWNDEDRMTNKSGDPRIGTHRRTYEPAESRTESRE